MNARALLEKLAEADPSRDYDLHTRNVSTRSWTAGERTVLLDQHTLTITPGTDAPRTNIRAGTLDDLWTRAQAALRKAAR